MIPTEESMEETQEETAKPGPKKEDITKPLLLITVVSSLGSLQCGYNLWVVYSPSVLLKDFYNISFTDESYGFSSEHKDRFLTGITIALFPLGGTLGSCVVGPLTDDYGRKCALLVNSVFSVVSAVLVACSTAVEGYEFTMIARFANGICSGIFYTAVPLYLSEVSPTSLRASIMLVPHLFIVIGVLIAQTLALREILGTAEGWPVVMSLGGVAALSQAIIIPHFPESPRFLLIQKRDEERARQVLKKLRNQEDVEEEIKELHQEDLVEKDEKFMNAFKLLSYPDLRQQVFNTIALPCSQQLVGVIAVRKTTVRRLRADGYQTFQHQYIPKVYHYTERIYKATKVGVDNVRYMSILLTATILLVVIVMTYIINFVERKTLLLTGLAVCGICCVLLFVSLQYQATILCMAYAGTMAVNMFLIAHALGPSPIPNIMTAEMFLQSSRSSAYVIQGFLYWVIYFISGVTYLNVEAKLQGNVFLIFIPFNIAAFIYTYKFLPETNNKTFLEIRMAAQETEVTNPTVT